MGWKIGAVTWSGLFFKISLPFNKNFVQVLFKLS